MPPPHPLLPPVRLTLALSTISIRVAQRFCADVETIPLHSLQGKFAGSHAAIKQAAATSGPVMMERLAILNICFAEILFHSAEVESKGN